MEQRVQRFFRARQIDPKDIKYLTRDNPRTLIWLFDGREISTAIPLKELMEHLPQEDFLSVTKGIALRRDQIVDISDQGVYTMTDGRAFQGRRRGLSQHKKLRQALRLPGGTPSRPYAPPMGLLEKCSLMDEMPLAFCVIELVFDKAGHGVDFAFRYCNREMETVEGVPLERMLNHSFYEVFANGDRKWLVAYADVALNGTRHILHDFSPEIGKTLDIFCYQPAPGHCACILVPT